MVILKEVILTNIIFMPKKTVDKKTTKSNLIKKNNVVSKNKNNENYILVIVESPGKIKKLESILGKGYIVTASYGHIMDLHPKKMSIDFENNFEPEYHVITGANKYQDKKKVVNDLKSKALKASKVIFAADEDREGEMIAWSYKIALNLKDNEYERITFNSITKDEVLKAISNPGKINMLMVESQKTRRILDRIVGFKISPGLNQIMGMRNLSAGRVQSIVTKLICEKELEIDNFFKGDNSSYFKVNSNMLIKKLNLELKCELHTSIKNDNNDDEVDENEDKEDLNEIENSDNDTKLKLYNANIISYEKAVKLMSNISKSVFKIDDIIVKQSKRYPSPPYTTSTAQQDASTKLGFNVKRTMNALQKLYEAGYTTYLRTDSTNLSSDALTQITKYVKDTYGKEYHNLRKYTNKKGNTQEAHEAIRPVKISKLTIPLGGKIGSDEQRMYNLIWKRTVASQMSPAEVDVYTINISISKEKKYYFKTKIDDITYPGFLAVYNIGIHGQDFNDMNDEYVLKIPKKKQTVIPVDVKCTEEYKKPPLRYSEAGLVRKMDPKNLNIGRPATYAEIINTIQKRNYVEVVDVDGVEIESRTLTWCPNKNDDIVVDNKSIHLGREKKKFKPTTLGIEVNNIMLRNFPELMDYKFTSNMETQLDNIAEGSLEWVKCLDKFWLKLEPLLKKMENEKKVERILGKNPETGYDVIASMGYHGPMLSMARSEKKKDTATAPIKKPYKLETITLKQALEVLKYPKILGLHKKKNVELKTGRYGFYVTWGKEGANLPDDINPDDIELDDALQYLEEKRKQSKEKLDKYLYYHKEGNIEYIVNTGKYGEDNKYLMVRDTSKKKGKPLFVSFPKTDNIDNLTLDRIKEIVEEGKKKKYNRNKKTKSIKKKTTTSNDKKTSKKLKVVKVNK